MPSARRADYLDHLLTDAVEPGGRLIVGVFNEERDRPEVEAQLGSWGFVLGGRASRPRRDSRLACGAVWIDRS